MCILSFFLWYNWLDEMAMKLKINCLECLYFSEAVLWEIPMVTVLNLLIWVFCIQLSGATMFNLSILTSDMWAVVIRIFFYKQQVFISKLCLILLSCYIDGLNPSLLSLMRGYEVLQLFQANASHLFTICVNRMKPDLILIPPLQVDWLYYLAFGIVVVGLLLYSTTYVLNLCLKYFFSQTLWLWISMQHHV